MAGRRRREKPVVTFAIYKPEYGEMRTYAGEAAREIIRGIVQSEAEKLPDWVDGYEREVMSD